MRFCEFMDICAVVMAAGEGKRMKSGKCKFIHQTAGKALILWVRDALEAAGVKDQVYIVGHMQEQVRHVLGEEVAFMIQDKQLGTGHAVMQASPFLEGRTGYTFVVRGDTPLLTGETLRNVLHYTRTGNFAGVMISAETNDNLGYERISRDVDGNVIGIVDAVAGKGNFYEGNSGLYCFDTALLVSALGKIGSKKRVGECNLSEVIKVFISEGFKVGAYKTSFEETLGVHDKYQLMQISKLLNRRICKKHMLEGVTIVDPDTTWISATVVIKPDATIMPNTFLEGDSFIGEDAVVGPDTKITDSYICDDAVVFNSIVTGSRIENGANVGPYAFVRQGTVISQHARIGHCVEVKNSVVGAYSKATNIGLIADAQMGENVSFGAGCITVNFDGNKMNKTVIGDNAFIGSNAKLIAPVRVSENAYIAAGSTITDDVPPYGMAIARSHQTIKDDWVLKKDRVRYRGV